jgi:hypothetical protein
MHAETARVRYTIDEQVLRLRPFAELAAHRAGRASTFQLNTLKVIQP